MEDVSNEEEEEEESGEGERTLVINEERHLRKYLHQTINRSESPTLQGEEMLLALLIDRIL
jgi:hypothetical protein